MNDKNQTVVSLISEFSEYLKSIQRSDNTIKAYARVWDRLKSFMDANKIEFFNKETGAHFLNSILGKDYDYPQLKQSQKK